MDIIPTGETLEQGADVKNEIIIDPPILAAQLKVYPSEYTSIGAKSICSRFDVVVSDYGINSLNIGCDSILTSGAREWKSNPAVSASDTFPDKFFKVESKSITEVVAFSSSSVSGIRYMQLKIGDKTCISLNEDDYETTAGLVAGSGVFEWTPPVDPSDEGDCTASMVFERVDCTTGQTYTDSFSFDASDGTIGIDTDWVDSSNRDHSELE